MNDAAAVADPARRAALALHALCDTDRAWMLASMPAAHRRLLEPLLEELRNLGLPRDGALVEGLAAAVAETSGHACAAPASPLTPAQAVHLAAWLEAEPAQVAARLLVACPGWRTALLGAFAPTTRIVVEREMPELVAAPALEEFLRAQALQCLQDMPAPRRVAWWTRDQRPAREAA